jgi:magnesium chelatase family protein
MPDLADLRGQPMLRHALEVAAAGGHSLLVLGPPGAGKSLAAHRLPSLLPPLSEHEALEVRRIAGIGGATRAALAVRPFRAPHHTISAAGLVGGGNPLRPGARSPRSTATAPSSAARWPTGSTSRSPWTSPPPMTWGRRGDQ